jgi:hypothetical protein
MFRQQLCFLAAHFLCHGRIGLDTGTHTYDKSLIADPANDDFFILIVFGLNAAHHSLIANRTERDALRWALLQVRWELPGNVGQEVDLNAQLLNGRSLMSRKYTNSKALIADVGVHISGSAKNPVRCRFIDPGTLRLCMGDGWNEKDKRQDDSVRDSHLYSECRLIVVNTPQKARYDFVAGFKTSDLRILPPS